MHVAQNEPSCDGLARFPITATFAMWTNKRCKTFMLEEPAAEVVGGWWRSKIGVTYVGRWAVQRA